MRLPIHSDTDAPLAAMWHAYRAAECVVNNHCEICTSVVHALLQSRYYDSSRGQFVSEDPTSLAVGNPGQLRQLTRQDQQQVLADPQNLNSYSYADNNPAIKKSGWYFCGPSSVSLEKYSQKKWCKPPRLLRLRHTCLLQLILNCLYPL